MRATASDQTHALRDELRSVFHKARVPTNPAIAAQILRLADDPNSSAEQFAEVIQADVALAARLLEMANRSVFAQREPVTNIKRAVTLLGLRRIRMVALGFQMVSHLDRIGRCPFDLRAFWQHSVLRACLAREVARMVVPAYAEEAFVVGLLQDCGILLLVQVLGEPYAHLYASENLSPTAFYLAEKDRFRFNHAEAIHAMALEWALPELIAGPLGRHHEPTQLTEGSVEEDRLAAVVYFVGSLRLAEGQTLAATEPQLAGYARRELGLDDGAIQACLERAASAFDEVAPLVPSQLSDDLDVASLLEEANRQLSAAVSDAELRVAAVEAERDRIRREQAQLRTALGQYRERAAQDPLTRLLNRGALTDATLACVRECRDRNLPLAVYFADIDDFKAINDDHGHSVGDEVLRLVAAAIGRAVINGGFAGRYGGEEFVLVIPAVDRDEARSRGQMILELVRRIRLVEPSPPRAIRCSVGAVWGTPGPGTSPNALFAAADRLMYKAKLAGKDRCCFGTLAGPRDDTPPARQAADEAPPEYGLLPELQEPVTLEQLRELAVRLNEMSSARYATMRKRERHSMVAPCTVRCFAAGSRALRSCMGCVRNISTGGAGLLTTQPLLRGEPVEIVVDAESPQGDELHIGGLVAFCRHVTGGAYEVGVQVIVQSREPIFTPDGSGAERLDWVVEALRTTRGD
jgi:diguanylate cyclase (GGDEF)-like protein